MTFGEKFKKLRIDSGLTQLEIAERLGLKTSQFISNIERGLAKIPINKALDYARALGVNPEIIEEKKQELDRRINSAHSIPPVNPSPSPSPFDLSHEERETVKALLLKLINLL